MEWGLENVEWIRDGVSYPGDLGSEVRVLLRVLEEVHELCDLCLGLGHASHIREPDTSHTWVPDDRGPGTTHVGLGGEGGREGGMGGVRVFS